MILVGGDLQLRPKNRAFAATIHAFQGRTVNRIVAAMPTGNPNLTNQQASYVAISRARDSAELVTDDAHRLADQLERATGERVAALDATDEKAAREAVFGRESAHERNRDHVTRAYVAMGRGVETVRPRDQEHEHRIDRDTGKGRGGKSSECSAGRDRAGQDSGKIDREINRNLGRTGGSGRESEHEKAVDLDLGV